MSTTNSEFGIWNLPISFHNFFCLFFLQGLKFNQNGQKKGAITIRPVTKNH